MQAILKLTAGNRALYTGITHVNTRAANRYSLIPRKEVE